MKRIEDLSIKDYHASKAIGKSDLDLINRSINHYLYKNEMFSDDNPSLIIGQAFHDAILSPDLYRSNYVTMPDDIKRKSGKAWEEFAAENENKTILSRDQAGKVELMYNNFHAHPKSMLFHARQAEISYFWERDEIECKCRPDIEATHFLADLKSTRDASYDAFKKSIYNYRYHVQAAWYIDGVNIYREQAGEPLIKNFIFIAVENSVPYNTAIYMLDESAIEEGRRQYQLDFLKFKEYINSPGEIAPFTGLSEEVLLINLPRFAFYN